MQIDPLDTFGKFITEKLRDDTIEFAERILSLKYKSERLMEIQHQIQSFDEQTCLSPLNDWTQIANQFSHSKFKFYGKIQTSLYT